MMTTLETLRSKNPNLPFYSVLDPEFKRYGRIVDFDASALIDACEEAAVMPAEKKCLYVTDLPELEALPDFTRAKRELRGEGSCQLGCCWGYNTMLNCLEYHRSSEHNIAVSDMVVLLAAQQDMEGLDLPAGKIVAFFVPKGTTVELYATTLHYAPCQTSDAGFRDIIVLPRGTNLPLTQKRPEICDGRLLWAQDKWLVAHPEPTADVEAGAYPGLHGENFDIRY